MAMRLLTQEEFFAELQKGGLEPTGEKTKKSEVWKDENGEFVTVPATLDVYPDFMLDEILAAMGNLYSRVMPIEQKVFEIKKRQE